ncbi:hypothetical protein [Pseudalkalibacillus caeni]|nr:hypothetical protein [Pseudalkalibacillus caeni]
MENKKKTKKWEWISDILFSIPDLIEVVFIGVRFVFKSFFHVFKHWN